MCGNSPRVRAPATLRSTVAGDRVDQPLPASCRSASRGCRAQCLAGAAPRNRTASPRAYLAAPRYFFFFFNYFVNLSLSLPLCAHYTSITGRCRTAGCPVDRSVVSLSRTRLGIGLAVPSDKKSSLVGKPPGLPWFPFFDP